MRGLRLFLLAILLCSERALGLQCYTCADIEKSGPCQPLQCLIEGVCYSSNITLTLDDGKQVKYKQKGCAPSCPEASRVLQLLAELSRQDDSGLWGLAKLEAQGLLCCAKDLCNGGPPRLGPGGGLVLGLGPVVLWALL